LEEEIHRILQSSSKLRNYSSELRNKFIKQEENFNQERKGWDRERNKWGQKLGDANTEIQKLRTHDLDLNDKARRLRIENANIDISLAKSKAENDIKSKKIRSLESMIKILEGKLSSTQKDVISIQNDSSKKETEIASLKYKIAELENIKSELESKVDELECLKSEAISKPIVGGNDEGQSFSHDSSSRPYGPVSKIKNTLCEEQSSITKPDDISAINEESVIRGYASSSKNLSKYFVRGKSMDQAEKIDGEITELPKNDTEINPKVSDETSISEISAKPHMSSLIKSNAQMRPSLEALPLPAVASTLMSPLSAYIFLALLIIAVVWFVRCRNIGRLEVPLLHRPEGATLGSKSHFFEIKGHKKSDRFCGICGQITKY
ncbi:5471_t:CDS:1, partial [Paraglomus brasilianum]